MGGALRYTLIGTLELAKSAREARDARRAIKVRRREPVKIGKSPEGFSKSFLFKVSF